MFLILATILISNLKPTREFHSFSETEILWEPDQDQNNNINWITIWRSSSNFDRRPTFHEVWEEEVDYFKQNFTISNQSDLMIKWLKSTFPEAPYMIYIANCESTGLVHRTNGKLLPNASGGSDRGVLQIHMDTHGTEIRKRGLNIEKNQDYFAFARILFDQSGINPWNSSKHCWKEHYQRIISRI